MVCHSDVAGLKSQCLKRAKIPPPPIHNVFFWLLCFALSSLKDPADGAGTLLNDARCKGKETSGEIHSSS